jgi:hypothetical protein
MKLSVRARLIQIAMSFGVSPERALDETLASDFAEMCAKARWRRAS